MYHKTKAKPNPSQISVWCLGYETKPRLEERVQFWCCILIYRCMQNHNDDTIKTSDTVLRKIFLSLYLKGLCVRGNWRPNRTATYSPPLLWPQQRFFPVLLVCSTEGLGAQPLWDMFSFQHLLSNWLNFLCTELYIFLRASKIALIQPVHGQGYILIFLDRMHLLLTQVNFLFWQPGRVGGQYTTLEPWWVWNTSSSSLLPGWLWCRMVVSDGVPYICLIDLLENYLYLIGILDI